MEYSIVHDKKDISQLRTLLTRLPEDWQRDEASMAIFRRSSKAALVIGRASLQQAVPRLGMSDVAFKAKPDKTKTIMRVGLVNKGKGRLGHLFNFGTVNRVQYSSGRKTGRIDSAKFASGWWDKKVPAMKESISSEMDKVAPQIISRYVRKYKK